MNQSKSVLRTLFGNHVFSCTKCRAAMDYAQVYPTAETAIVDTLCEKGKRLFRAFRTEQDAEDRQIDLEAAEQLAILKDQLEIPDRTNES